MENKIDTVRKIERTKAKEFILKITEQLIQNYEKDCIERDATSQLKKVIEPCKIRKVIQQYK